MAEAPELDPTQAADVPKGPGSMQRARWTDSVQATCAVGLLALAVFGYFYTVRPTYLKDRLDKEVGELQEELKKFRQTNRTYVVKQFLGKVESDAQSYKCSPTVYDLGARNQAPPPPKTGEALIEINFKNPEFLLISDNDRLALIGSIEDFAKRRYGSTGFTSALETQHTAHFTGPLAGIELDKRQGLFRFSQTERDDSEAVFQSFDAAMTALQTYLLPNNSTPIKSRPCIDLGIAPN
jgi:hypothetical protein